MKKILSLFFVLVCEVANSQFTPWGLQLIQQPNLVSGQKYLGITNFYAGNGVTFRIRPQGGFFIDSNGGSSTNGCAECLTNGQAGVTLSGTFSGTGTGLTISASQLTSGIIPYLRFGSAVVTNVMATNDLTLSIVDNTLFVPTNFASVFQVANMIKGTNSGTYSFTGNFTGNGTFNAFALSSNFAGDDPAIMTNINGEIYFLNDISDPTDLGNMHAEFVGTFTGNASGVSNAPLWLGIASGGSNGAPIAMNVGLDAFGKVTTNDPSSVTVIVTNGIQIVSTNDTPISSTASNIHFWAGANVSLWATNRNSGNIDIRIDSTGGGSGGGSFMGDYPGTNMPPYSGGSNFYVDFSWPVQTWVATNFILNYSTNGVGSTSTGRISWIYIPKTNISRSIAITGDATNWSTWGVTFPQIIPAGYSATIIAQSFNSGETNIFVSFKLSNTPQWGAVTGFSPMSVPGLVLWLSGNSAYSDVAMTSPCNNGDIVKGWKDLSGSGNSVTNGLVTNIVYSANGGPNSNPVLIFGNGSTASSSLFSRTLVNYAQPNYIFVVETHSANNGYFFAGTNMACFVDSSTLLKLANGGTLTSYGNYGLNAYRIFTEYQDSSPANTFVRTNAVTMSNQAVGNSAIRSFCVGGSLDGTFQLTCRIAEILVYNADVGGANRTNIERYLAAKYSLPGP